MTSVLASRFLLDLKRAEASHELARAPDGGVFASGDTTSALQFSSTHGPGRSIPTFLASLDEFVDPAAEYKDEEDADTLDTGDTEAADGRKVLHSSENGDTTANVGVSV